MKKAYKHILALGISVCFILVVWWKMGIYFQTNDDRYITEILSGAATGQPDARINCVNYLLTLPLSLLYRITTEVPWYGGCLIVFMGASYFVITDSALSRTKRLCEVVGVVFLAGVLFLSQLFMLAQLQFTCVAAFMAMAGYAGLLLYQDKRAGWVSFGILQFLAFLLRDQAMLMIQPLGGAVLLGLLCMQNERTWRERFLEAARYVGIVAAVLVVGLGGNAIAYHGQQWQEWKEFNQARVTLFDYHRRFSYDEVEHILKKYDVTPAEYEAFFDYVILRWDITTDCAKELVAYATEHGESTGLTQVGAGMWEFVFSDNYRGMNKVLLAAFVCVLLWAALPGNRRMLLPLLGITGAEGLLLFYLLWKGRFPLRIAMPLLVCTIYLLAVLFWRFYSDNREVQKSRLQYFLLPIMGVLLLAMSYKSGQVQYRDAAWLNRQEAVSIRELAAITEYCNARQEQAFFLDTYSVVDLEGSALETGIYGERNHRITGIWYANAPHIMEANQVYLESKAPGVSVIIKEDGQQLSRATVRYFAEATGSEPVQTDTIVTDSGSCYAVISFAGAFRLQEGGAGND